MATEFGPDVRTEFDTEGQDACLMAIGQKACELTGLALDGHDHADFSADRAAVLVIELLAIVWAGFEARLDRPMLQRLVAGSGVGWLAAGLAANDEGRTH